MFGKPAVIRARPANATDLHSEIAQILQGEHKTSVSSTAPILPDIPTADEKMSVTSPTSGETETDSWQAEELISLAQETVSRLCHALVSEVTLHSRLLANNQLIITLACTEPGILIGRRAQVLNSLQYLAARIVSHRLGRSIDLVLDIESYRSRRQQQLEETAIRLAQKAEQQGRPCTMPPLSTPDRRVVHKALKGRLLQTFSKGQGDFKRIVIVPDHRKPSD